ncbi:hypothetical protein ANO11243_087290 [Dothideomycetidae sp. 11243]|nr:hypothetical protein ANO11243_087290 [fungal sp. No.11243]
MVNFKSVGTFAIFMFAAQALANGPQGGDKTKESNKGKGVQHDIKYEVPMTSGPPEVVNEKIYDGNYNALKAKEPSLRKTKSEFNIHLTGNDNDVVQIKAYKAVKTKKEAEAIITQMKLWVETNAKVEV